MTNNLINILYKILIYYTVSKQIASIIWNKEQKYNNLFNWIEKKNHFNYPK